MVYFYQLGQINKPNKFVLNLHIHKAVHKCVRLNTCLLFIASRERGERRCLCCTYRSFHWHNTPPPPIKNPINLKSKYLLVTKHKFIKCWKILYLVCITFDIYQKWGWNLLQNRNKLNKIQSCTPKVKTSQYSWELSIDDNQHYTSQVLYMGIEMCP